MFARFLSNYYPSRLYEPFNRFRLIFQVVNSCLAVALEIPKLAAELTLRAAKLWVVIFVKITDGKILVFYGPCTQDIKWSSNLHHPRSKKDVIEWTILTRKI